MKSLYLHIILLLLTCAACKDGALAPKEQLPPATQEGRNTFGCLVNGEVWVPNISINPSIHRLTGYFSEGYFYLRANRTKEGKRQSFGLDHKYIDSIGIYSLEPTIDQPIIQVFFKDSEDRYDTDSVATPGELNISYLDTSKRIISGTFYFDAINEAGKVMEIRDGRFDLKY